MGEDTFTFILPRMTDNTINTQNQLLVQSLYEEFINPGRLDEMSRLISPSFVSQTFTGDPGEQGPEEFRLAVARLREAFPDLHFAIEDIFAENDRVAVRWQMTGTHQGAFAGAPATGRQIRQPGIVIYHVRNGLIERAWRQSDRVILYQQIGLLTDPVGTTTRTSA